MRSVTLLGGLRLREQLFWVLLPKLLISFQPKVGAGDLLVAAWRKERGEKDGERREGQQQGGNFKNKMVFKGEASRSVN
ncbi:hypothetical protein scyTo_0021546 [Scyliorhinus torazame]|uniref:Uncharacterized protein n=1 Tax=Scyliorhinus torazame TaxID=75743 RepID=A0A401Q9X2_SCYTO|nr:hypothetical protein [Scyliorhinus torazame]